jgi:hypothetical protein
MTQLQASKKPISLVITSILSLAATAFYIILYAVFPVDAPYPISFSLLWAGIMIFMHLIVAVATVLMLRRKLLGIWIWLLAKVALFVIPQIAGTIDSVLGLLTPILFLESAIFLIAFGMQVKHFR